MCRTPAICSWWSATYGSETTPSQSYPDYRDLRDKNRSFDSLVTYDIMGGVGLDTGKGNPSVVWPYMVSGNYFDALGIQPYLGRFIHASEEHGKNSMPEIVLSYALGTVISTATPPRWAASYRSTSIPSRSWASRRRTSAARSSSLRRISGLRSSICHKSPVGDLEERGNHYAWIIGHLKPGVTPAAATSDLNTIAASLAKTYPKSDDGLKFSLSHPGLAGNTLGRPTRAFMAGLMLLAGLILLAACANLGSLFAARAADRSREIAIRMALGSRRKFILRQLLTEALLVSVAGGICGMAAAVGILRVLSTWRPIPNIPINVPVNPDAKTYILALLLAVFSGLLFGLVPVRQVLRSDPWQVIRSGAVSAGGVAASLCATCCSGCRSPSVLFSSPRRLLRCAAWRVRSRATMAFSQRTRCW